jgi:outer membrane lipoprotein carrier protein
VVVLAKVQAFYDATRDLSARFRQVHKHPVYGTKDVSAGKLRLKKPGMMHWDYSEKADHDVYADGEKLWIIERDTRQVIARDVAGSDFAAAVGFLFGGRKLVEEFRVRLAKPAVVKRYGAKGHDVIELKPKKKNPHYKYVTLVVDQNTGRVDAFVVRNGDDSTNHFTLSNVATNTGLKTKDLRPRIPKGYVVIEE